MGVAHPAAALAIEGPHGHDHHVQTHAEQRAQEVVDTAPGGQSVAAVRHCAARQPDVEQGLAPAKQYDSGIKQFSSNKATRRKYNILQCSSVWISINQHVFRGNYTGESLTVPIV